MNLRALVLAPWIAAHASTRWLVLGLCGLCTVGAIVLDMAMPTAQGARVALVIYGAGTAFTWAFYMPGCFLLAYDARRLRIPGLQRTAIAAIWLCAGATIALGTAIGAHHGLGAATSAALIALTTAAGFAFSLLPRYLSVFIGFLPALGQFVQRVVPAFPALTDPRAAVWYGAMAALFALACLFRWQRLMAGGAELSGLSGSLVMQLRSNGGMGGLGSVRQAGTNQLIRQRPAWLQPEADLRHTGPASPVKSLRVALGGWYVPQTWRGLFRQGLTVAWPIGLFVLVMLMTRAGDRHAGHWGDFLEGFAAGMSGVLCVTASLGAPLISALMLRQRWSTPQRELALLAVLPGLGSPGQARGALLRAALVRPVAINLILAIGASGVAFALHLCTLAALAVVAAPLLCAVAGVALLLDALGNHPLPGWALGLAFSVMTTVVFATGFTAMIASQLRQGGAWATSPTLWTAFVGMVVLVIGVSLWIGRRAARRLFAQPHPFLAHA
ncbi:MAG TPA: hypothetical protein VFR91_06210 [Dyella sp.]|nr:hypothetical protein [Dyella sp.]